MHRNNYKHHYERTFSKEEILDYFEDGWVELINDAYTMMSYIPGAEICSAKRCFGMLHMFVRCPEEIDQNAAEGIAWKVERLSSNTCERCGKWGTRRKELKKVYCLCTDCYLQYLNEVEDPMSLFRKGHEGRFLNKGKE